MLKPMQLDCESYEEILKEAVMRIPQIYPRWTNYNKSDPGITILELMAYLTEIQRYHLNFLGDEHYLRYLKLVGVTPREACAAQTHLKIEADGVIAAGTVYYADSIPFETVYEINASDNEIVSLENEEETFVNEGEIISGNGSNFIFYPFGKKKQTGVFSVNFKKSFNAGDKISLYFKIKKDENCTQITDEFIKYVNFHVQVRSGEIVKNAQIIIEQTKGFQTSGEICIKIPKMSDSYRGCTSFEFVIDEGEYEHMPAILGVYLNVVQAKQKYTYSKTKIYHNINNVIETFEKPYELYGVDGERRIRIKDYTYDSKKIFLNNCEFKIIQAVFCTEEFKKMRIIANAYGLCGYRVKTDIQNILPESLEVFVDDPEDGIYRWERVDDFDASDKNSRHYVFDSQTNEFIFSNGEKGMPPWGNVIIAGCEVSQMENGNVKLGMVNSFDETSKSRGINITPSTGGMSRQSLEDCFKQAAEEINRSNLCITLKDYELAVKSTPGVRVKRVKAFLSEQEENCICIAVETKNGDEKINKASLENFKAHILNKTVVGTKIEFISPRYSKIRIYAEISVDYSYEDYRKLTEKAVKNYFDSKDINFGGRISKSSFSRYMYQLAWIKEIKVIDINAQAGSAEVLENGDVKLKNRFLPLVQKINLTISD